MNIRIPTQILAYVIGLIAVVVVIGGLSLVISQVQKRIERKHLQDAVKEKPKKID
jgi:hypothetical protein